MSNCEKLVKELADKLGFHLILTGLISWVEWQNKGIFTDEDEYIGSVLAKLKDAQAAYVARYTTNA